MFDHESPSGRTHIKKPYSVSVPSLSETSNALISRWIWMHCHQSNYIWQRWEMGSCYIWQYTLSQKSDCTRKI